MGFEEVSSRNPRPAFLYAEVLKLFLLVKNNILE